MLLTALLPLLGQTAALKTHRKPATLKAIGITLLPLIHKSIEAHFANIPAPILPELSPPKEVRGVFVTLSVKGKVRGCSGTFSLTNPSIAEETIHHAIRAATADRRYPSIQPKEIPHLKASITFILSSLQQVFSLDFYNPIHQGVLFKSKGESLLFLPGERRYPQTLLEEAKKYFSLETTQMISFYIFQAKRIGEEP